VELDRIANNRGTFFKIKQERLAAEVLLSYCSRCICIADPDHVAGNGCFFFSFLIPHYIILLV
jgi:hypothetical protein